VGVAAWLVRRGVVPAARCRPFQSFEGREEALLRAAGIRNEIAAFDPPGGEVRTGVPALAWVAEGGALGGLLGLAMRRPLQGLATLAYRTVSYNRRILAPVRPGEVAACGCEPDPHAGYRTIFVAALFACAAACFALFGAVAGEGAGVLSALLALGVGWGLPALLTALLARGGGLAAHVAWISATSGLALLAGALPLVLVRLLAPGRLLLPLAAGIAAGAVVLAARVALRRAAILGRSKRWVLAWLAFAGAGLALAVLRLGR
jgi:hypothetical protein